MRKILLWVLIFAIAFVQQGYAMERPVDPLDILAESIGGFAVGRLADGTVQAAGDNSFGQCDVQDWSGIVKVCVGYAHTVGLCADGTVVAVGDNGEGQCETSDWSDIVDIAADIDYTIGLKRDGTLVWTRALPEHDRNILSTWTNIESIFASWDIHGVTADGIVYTTAGAEPITVPNVKQVLTTVDTMYILDDEGAVYCRTLEGGTWFRRYEEGVAQMCYAGYMFYVWEDGTVTSESVMEDERSSWRDVAAVTLHLGLLKDGSVVCLTGEQMLQEASTWKLW